MIDEGLPTVVMNGAARMTLGFLSRFSSNRSPNLLT
jgi:hypothetical protein